MSENQGGLGSVWPEPDERDRFVSARLQRQSHQQLGESIRRAVHGPLRKWCLHSVPQPYALQYTAHRDGQERAAHIIQVADPRMSTEMGHILAHVPDIGFKS